MIFRQFRRLSISLIFGATALISCNRAENRRSPAAVPTAPRDTAAAPKSLPAGRYQLPIKFTPVPGLWITLPPGYAVKALGQPPNDEFFVFRTEDPSLTDSSRAASGFLRVFVGPKPQTGLDRGEKFTLIKGYVGDRPVEWKAWSDTLKRALAPAGGPAATPIVYYMREYASSDYFAFLSPEMSRAKLNLHVYVAGTDSSQVRLLMNAARTISVRS